VKEYPLIVLLIFVMSFYAGCSKHPTPEQLSIQRAVRQYDTAIINAYKTGNVSRLHKIASPAEVSKVQILINLMEAEKGLMKAHMRELKFTGVWFTSHGFADAATEERWSYRHYNPRTGIPTDALKIKDYNLKYKLIKTKDRWKVFRVEVRNKK